MNKRKNLFIMEKKNIYKALAKFQQEVPVIHKGTKGYGYSYADLPAIFEVINPLLAKHGLGFTQLLGDAQITTLLFHFQSGEEIESTMTIPDDVKLKGMNDFQVMGSAITYYRRYSLSAMLGLVTDKDIDASGEQQPKQSKQPAKVDPKKAITTLSKAKDLKELKQIWTSLTSSEQNHKEVIAKKDELKGELG